MLHLGLMTLYLDASCAWCAMLMHVHQERVLFFGGYVGIFIPYVVNCDSVPRVTCVSKTSNSNLHTPKFREAFTRPAAPATPTDGFFG